MLFWPSKRTSDDKRCCCPADGNPCSPCNLPLSEVDLHVRAEFTLSPTQFVEYTLTWTTTDATINANTGIGGGWISPCGPNNLGLGGSGLYRVWCQFNIGDLVLYNQGTSPDCTVEAQTTWGYGGGRTYSHAWTLIEYTCDPFYFHYRCSTCSNGSRDIYLTVAP